MTAARSPKLALNPFVPGAAGTASDTTQNPSPTTGSFGGTSSTQSSQISGCLPSTDRAAGAGGLWKSKGLLVILSLGFKEKTLNYSAQL